MLQIAYSVKTFNIFFIEVNTKNLSLITVYVFVYAYSHEVVFAFSLVLIIHTMLDCKVF